MDAAWEARSKCEHLAGVPLKPAVAQRLYIVTLVKGAVGTTAIEGNTLTEDQVLGIIEGSYKAPPSRQYQEQEVRNVIDVRDICPAESSTARTSSSRRR